MYRLVDEHRGTFGVEPICAVVQIAPSAYRRHAARQRDRSLLSARARRDDALMPKVEAVWNANLRVYGADKVWKQMNREGDTVARCTVERLMRRLGLRGVKRGKVVRTTISDTKVVCPLDKVNRQFRAQRPNQLWVSDFTYVSTWQGWLYVAFVVDVFARRIVGWRTSSSMTTDRHRHFSAPSRNQFWSGKRPTRSLTARCQQAERLNRPGFRGGRVVRVRPARPALRVDDSSLLRLQPVGYSRWARAGDDC